MAAGSLHHVFRCLFEDPAKYLVEVGNTLAASCFVEPEQHFGGSDVDVDHLGAYATR